MTGLTVNDHVLGSDDLLLDGGDFTDIAAAEIGRGSQDLKGAVALVVVARGAVVEIQAPFEDAQILRPLPRDPLVDGRRLVGKVPLDDQLAALIGSAEDVVAVEDHGRRRARLHHQGDSHLHDFQLTRAERCCRT